MFKYCFYCKKKFSTYDKKRKFCSQECYHKSCIKENKILIEENYAILEIQKDNIKYNIKIDKEDIIKIKKYTWHLNLRKRDNRLDVCSTSRGSHKEKRKYLHLARYLMNCPENLQIDHINRNTLDNRKNNLRICSNFINQQNKGNNTSGCVGVVWCKDKNKWKAEIGYKNKNIFLGYFNDIEDAIKMRKDKELELFCK